MEGISIVLRRPPYGSVDASEAIRNALGGVTDDVPVKLILLDGGVSAAKKGQDVSTTGYIHIEAGIKDCIDMGVEVYLDKASMKEEFLDSNDVIDGAIIASSPEIAEAIAGADLTMIF